MAQFNFTKNPGQIRNNLNKIADEYKAFNDNMTAASNCIEEMKTSWFGPQRDEFVKIWNKNIDVVNTYLNAIYTDSSNLNNRFKVISGILGFKLSEIVVKKLHLSSFPQENKDTGNIDTSKLGKTLTSYVKAMKDSITNLATLKDADVTPSSIGITDTAGGGFSQDMKRFSDDLNHIHSKINELHNDTKGFVNDYISLLNKGNS